MKTKQPQIVVKFGTKPSKSAKAKDGKNFFVELYIDGKLDKAQSRNFYYSMKNCKRGAMRLAKRNNCKFVKA